MILPVGIGSAEEGGYQIERSLRFNSADSAYLNRTFGTATSRTTWTWSGWVKRGALGVTQQIFASRPTSSPYALMYFLSGNVLEYDDNGSMSFSTTQVFRDVSAWYHIVVAIDTTQATNTNRIKVYVNGSQVTAFNSVNYPTQNYQTQINSATAHAIGKGGVATAEYFSGYLTEINFIDGSALDPTSFGEFNEDTGVWQPKAYTGSYGTNGFYLNFSDNATTTTLGDDLSGNGNDWTPNNFSVTAGAGNDSLVDTPTNYGTDTGVGGEVRGNYATLNAVSGYAVTLTNGNLDYTTGTSSNPVTSTWSLPTSGKWYWEVTVSSVAEAMIGIQTRNNLAYAGPKTVYYRQGGASNSIFIEGSANAYNASSYTNGNVIAVGYDADNSQIRWYKDNVQQGGPYTLTSLDNLTPIIIQASASGSNSGAINFGQRPFAYTAPSGFKALCTQNLPEPTIVDGGEYFNTVLYTGNGSTQTISGVGFQPDWTWVKGRSVPQGNSLYDVLRGYDYKVLSSDSTSAQVTETGGVSAVASDGFSLNGNNTIIGGSNGSGETYVAWNWKANGSGVSNTAGTITSTVSANTDSGFSIVTYTGNSTTNTNFTVGHGLGVTPSMVIIKNRDWASGVKAWQVWHTGLGNNTLALESTNAQSSGDFTYSWNTQPNSTVFTVRADTVASTANRYRTNGQTNGYVAYCFAAIPGYSAFGSYTGNGSADGPFVYTGFRPAFVMMKRTDSTSAWVMKDTSRNPYNTANLTLFANYSLAEETSARDIDLLSNGFKHRQGAEDPNRSGTYIYMAFAENPFKYSLAR